MKKQNSIIMVVFISLLSILMINSCATTSKIAAKSGPILWGKNCQRCHNTPSPSDYGDAQWEVIGMHMKLRANITDVEKEKIVAFLQSAN